MPRRIKKHLDPIDRDILRTLQPLRLKVTPFKIAKAINVHPVTVQRRMQELDRKSLTKCIKKGNRTLCELDPDFKLRSKRKGRILLD